MKYYSLGFHEQNNYFKIFNDDTDFLTHKYK